MKRENIIIKWRWNYRKIISVKDFKRGEDII